MNTYTYLRMNKCMHVGVHIQIKHVWTAIYEFMCIWYVYGIYVYMYVYMHIYVFCFAYVCVNAFMDVENIIQIMMYGQLYMYFCMCICMYTCMFLCVFE